MTKVCTKYAQVPDFDQQTQAVYQLEPVDMGDHVYVGVEVVDLPEADEEIEM